jgi:hypothetical protein
MVLDSTGVLFFLCQRESKGRVNSETVHPLNAITEGP